MDISSRLYLNFIVMVLAATTVSCSADLKLVRNFCQQGLEFDSIEAFQEFIKSFKRISDKQLEEKCRSSVEAILELDDIIVTNNVCDRYNVQKLIKYHRKYLAKNSVPKPITYSFFRKYAIQVAYVCKKNLVRNLELARQELKDRSIVFDEAREKVFQDEPSIKTNMRLLSEQPDDLACSNVKPANGVELGLNEYREALTKLNRVEDILVFDPSDCKRNRNREIKVSLDKINVFFKPILLCHQLHRYYGASLSSIAWLANVGYTALDEDLDAELTDNHMVKDWIIAAQLCDPMLYMKTVSVQGDWAIVDTCSDEVQSIEIMVFDDDIEKLEIEKIREMIPKSEATRSNAQKLMKSTMRKIAKIDFLRQLSKDTSSKSIFRKSLNILASQRSSTNSPTANRDTIASLTGQLTDKSPQMVDPAYSSSILQPPLSEQEAFKILMEVANIGKESLDEPEGAVDRMDEPVSFDILSTAATFATVFAIMSAFEWIFFIVMTLAARLCHHLYFNFENMLTFPPRVLSWSDADFARLSDKLERLDEDDYFDYDELSPQEQKQRLLLAKVFGRPPPMLYKD